MENYSDFATLDRLLKACMTRHPADGELVQAIGLTGNLREKFSSLQADLQKLTETPLQYAIYLGPSPHDERDVLVGIGSGHYEVRLADELHARKAELCPGQQVLLNDKQNVVAVRNEYARGETADVVNVLKPAQCAEVLLVHEADGVRSGITGKWRDGEEKRFACGPRLQATPLRRGDIVAIDPETELATDKIRPRLHVRAGGSEGTIVEISDRLFEEGVRVGESVRVDTGLKFAFEKLPSRQVGGLALEEVPDVTYDDIGGLTEQIEEFRDAIELPYLQRALFRRYQLTRPKGILLYGPPGCGKTMVAKAIARSLTESIKQHLQGLEQRIRLYLQLLRQPADAEALAHSRALLDDAALTAAQAQQALADGLRAYDLDMERLEEELRDIGLTLNSSDGVRSYFLNVKGPELLNKYVGETEQRIRGIFEEARSVATFHTPVIIFFDEMEAMFRARGTGRSSDVETTIVPQFLAELDGVESAANVLLVGATNRHELIDPAILRPGRLDVKIRISRPNRAAAAEIFALYLTPLLPLAQVPPSTPQLPGKLVFRTAYSRLPAELAEVAADLPPGCDVRLARSFSAAELAQLADLPPDETLRQVSARGTPDGTPDGTTDACRTKCGRFKGSLKVRDISGKLRQFAQHYQADSAFTRRVDELARQEQAAEDLIEALLELLYNASTYLRVLTRVPHNQSSARYVFPAQDFITGAVIANLVTRAKRSALKRQVAATGAAPGGITYADLEEAMQQEFSENREQWAVQKLRDELGRPGEEVQMAEFHLGTGTHDPWGEEKPRPYRVAASPAAS